MQEVQLCQLAERLHDREERREFTKGTKSSVNGRRRNHHSQKRSEVIMARKARGKGEGCVSQQGGRWFAFISLGYDGAGKRSAGSASMRTRNAGGEGRSSRDAGRVREGWCHPVRTDDAWRYARRWLEAMRAALAARHSRGIRSHVAEPYAAPTRGHSVVAVVTASAFSELAASMETDGVGAATRRHVVMSLGRAASSGVKMRLLSSNPAKPSRCPKSRVHESQGSAR